MKKIINIFLCYAHEDEKLLDQLRKHLRILQRQELIDTWHDGNISAGAKWEQEINTHLSTADIVLLLISPDFMVSDYCYGVQMRQAMDRHEKGEVRVIPVILRSAYWQESPFGKLQILPKDGVPIMRSSWRWPDGTLQYYLDDAFFYVAEGIRETVEQLARAVTYRFNTAYQNVDDIELLLAYNDIQCAPNHQSFIFTLQEQQRMQDILKQKAALQQQSRETLAMEVQLKGQDAAKLASLYNDQNNHLPLAFYKLLDPKGIELTSEQEALMDEILRDAFRREQRVFIIQGGPGSGKTTLAVNLLLRGLQKRALRYPLKCVLALHNSRLRAVLQHAFNNTHLNEFLGANGAVMFFGNRNKTGLGDEEFEGEFDLIICDEAEQMKKGSVLTILQRAPVCVVFLDEAQILNTSGAGTVAIFQQASLVAGKTPVIRQLTETITSNRGQLYRNWITNLFNQPEQSEVLALPHQSWRNDYQFIVCESAEQMVDQLKELSQYNPDQQVALVASLTESPVDQGTINNFANLRVGYPLASGWQGYYTSNLSIRWVTTQQDYVNFWMGKSNNLEQVASVYRARGFECDYIGIFWGRDLIMYNNQWILGDANVCYDRIDGLVIGSQGNWQWASNALTLLQNRYRILLTRGIKGTFVFCEDPDTRKYLLSLQRGEV